ncbi:helix-turn-helix domain-containing protein [Rhodococcus opacus]|uniref:sigma-54-dependent Fis family transcriptional regulator n=1 Tax=Rhodococcus opacus TaxID=37919 RepID=UPI000B2ECF6D|nr:helix-turn-helix domain-containing protein [Rhodococcus opacus]MDX5965284.1 helix-turn-helix domain-containing protein [Rhodococcus opacus]NKY76721.1 hypothetical protein [Rhodococcus opacus]CAG7618703.1 hypothetical protein E143388_06095 [Rhodococcus opacus]
MSTESIVMSGQRAAAFAGDRDVVRRYQFERDAMIDRGKRDAMIDRGMSPGSVREDIQMSWRRSLMSGVEPGTPQTPRNTSVDSTSRLLAVARPTLERIREGLIDTDFSLLLLDRNGWVLDRQAGSKKMASRLDENLTVPGYSLAEQFTGTNGPGTALELGRPIQISGPEHFADRYQDLTCAAVPIFHPITGRLEGAVNLTCPFSQTSALMLPFVANAAAEIQRSLASQLADRERLFLHEFMAACQRTADPVVALSESVLMANPAAARLFDSVDQTMLWERAASIAGSKEATEIWEWQTSVGEALQMHCRPVLDGTHLLGAIIHGKPLNPVGKRDRSLEAATSFVSPGVVLGRSRAMAEVGRLAASIADHRTSCLVLGEAGSGKLTMARGIAKLICGRPEPVVLDAAVAHLVGPVKWLRSVVAALENPGGATILAHVDALDERTARTLAACIDAHDNSWVLATSASADAEPASGLEALLGRLRVVQLDIPALRSRPEDLSALVSAFLDLYGRPGQKFGAGALQTIGRLEWLGNVRELENVVKWTTQSTSATNIDSSDLPAAVLRKSSSRHLTPVEQAELDTIVQAVKDARGNKVEAARQLGLARSTLYRKLRSYGIDVKHTIL